ncbi:MAG TPA: hypothetical protein VF075_08325 [Pyrinomonadaceae bacterium]
MNVGPISHERIKGYLLGQIPEEDESQVEAGLLTDPEFYEELSIVEDELIDQYLAGALSVSDRQSFESHFVLSSERQQKIRFARALRKRVSVAANESELTPAEDELLPEPAETTRLVSTPRSSSIFPIGKSPVVSYATAAILLVVVAGFFMVVRYWQSPPGTGRVLAIELIPTPATRDASDVKQFTLTPDIESVHLQLDLLKNEYQSYDALLRDSSLRTVTTTKNLKPQVINGVSAVLLDVKADLLPPGTYRINLSGTTADGRSESVATFSLSIGK